MKTPDFWKTKNILSYFLLPLSLLYNLSYKCRYLLNKIPYKSKIPVICIGNIVAGGAGKTPVAIAISKLLKKKHKTFCFLTKGYNGISSGVVKVNNDIHLAKEVGDEPLLLALHGDVYVSRDRVLGLTYINNLEKKYDFIIVDDGLQNPTFHKDLPILVINGRYGFGNNMLFPAGPLRESFEQVKDRVKRIVIIDKDKCGIKKLCEKYNKKYIFGENRINLLEDYYKYKFVAFAGLGNPQKFFDTLDECNIITAKKLPFPDHYLYTNYDLANLNKMTENGKFRLITTHKDWVRLNEEDRKDIYYIDMYVNLLITDRNNFLYRK